MPSVIIHRCVSKKVLEKTNLFNNNKDIYLYDVGSLAPDSWRNTERFKDSLLPKIDKRKYSHFSNEGEFIERYEVFFDKYKNNLNNPFFIGYLVHLITDNFWRYDMHYKYFNLDGSIKIFDNDFLNADKNRKKDLLNDETKKITNKLVSYCKIIELRHLTDDEINTLPLMEEFEYDGINDSIDYNNMEVKRKDNNDFELRVYKEKDFIEGIDRCSNFVISELIKYGIIKDNQFK